MEHSSIIGHETLRDDDIGIGASLARVGHVYASTASRAMNAVHYRENATNVG